MFQAFPKIPRLNRSCIATEKIDGTNSAIVIVDSTVDERDLALPIAEVGELWFYAQSRKRLIQPGKATDNFGFAGWVADNVTELAKLGPGRHFGEWWGSGIQRGYGLNEKRFSLFNVSRWYDESANGLGEAACPDCCNVVPVLAAGTAINAVATGAIEMLEENGSFAAPGFGAPEGVVIYHAAAKQSFKVTVEGDDAAKGVYKGMHA